MEKGRKIEAMTDSLPALKLGGESRQFVLSSLAFIIYVLSHVSDIRNTFLKEKKCKLPEKEISNTLPGSITQSLNTIKLYLPFLPIVQVLPQHFSASKKYCAGYNGRTGI